MGTVKKLKIQSSKFKIRKSKFETQTPKRKTQIYILHGWTYTTEKWNPFLDELKKKNIDFEFLKIPGLTAPIEKVWYMSDYTAWLKDKIISEPVALLGHSNGGRIALAFTNAYPEKVSQLFLLDSAGLIHNDIFSKSKRAVFKSAAKIGKAFLNSEKAKKILYRLAREEDYKNAPPIMKKTMENLISLNIQPILKDIKTPTVIIWGKNDKVTPFSDSAIFKRELPHSKLFLIESARHSPMFTHVKEVVKIVSENLL